MINGENDGSPSCCRWNWTRSTLIFQAQAPGGDLKCLNYVDRWVSSRKKNGEFSLEYAAVGVDPLSLCVDRCPFRDVSPIWSVRGFPFLSSH